jgi:CRP/FNR family transcriptional regulator, cyclic AMP receptor protein
MSQINKLETLCRSPLAAELDGTEIQALADQMGEKTLQDRETLVAEGDTCRTLFLVAAGTLEVLRGSGATEESIYKMRVGECVGIRAFVEGAPYMFGLRATGATSVMTLEPDALETLDQRHPRLPYKVMRAFVRIHHVNLMKLYLESTELRNYMMKTGGRY